MKANELYKNNRKVPKKENAAGRIEKSDSSKKVTKYEDPGWFENDTFIIEELPDGAKVITQERTPNILFKSLPTISGKYDPDYMNKDKFEQLTNRSNYLINMNFHRAAEKHGWDHGYNQRNVAGAAGDMFKKLFTKKKQDTQAQQTK